MNNSAPKLPTAVTLSVVAIVGLLACLVTFLIWTNHDPSNLISFVVAIVPATIGVILVGHRVDAVARTTEQINQTTDQVAQRVNGELDANFASIHQRLDAINSPVPPMEGQQ